MPHLNFAHKTSFPLAACPFYIIFLGDVTHCAGSRCVWRSYTSLFNRWFSQSFSNFPRFSLDLACAYSTFQYVAGRDTILGYLFKKLTICFQLELIKCRILLTFLILSGIFFESLLSKWNYFQYRWNNRWGNKFNLFL